MHICRAKLLFSISPGVGRYLKELISTCRYGSARFHAVYRFLCRSKRAAFVNAICCCKYVANLIEMRGAVFLFTYQGLENKLKRSDLLFLNNASCAGGLGHFSFEFQSVSIRRCANTWKNKFLWFLLLVLCLTLFEAVDLLQLVKWYPIFPYSSRQNFATLADLSIFFIQLPILPRPSSIRKSTDTILTITSAVLLLSVHLSQRVSLGYQNEYLLLMSLASQRRYTTFHRTSSRIDPCGTPTVPTSTTTPSWIAM